jgi:hypothetical protein
MVSSSALAVVGPGTLVLDSEDAGMTSRRSQRSSDGGLGGQWDWAGLAQKNLSCHCHCRYCCCSVSNWPHTKTEFTVSKHLPPSATRTLALENPFASKSSAAGLQRYLAPASKLFGNHARHRHSCVRFKSSHGGLSPDHTIEVAVLAKLICQKYLILAEL